MKKILFAVVFILLLFTSCKNNEYKIITHFDTNVADSYEPPALGTTYCEHSLEAAREYYLNQKVKFLVSCRFFDEDGETLTISEEERNTEYKRLYDNTYDLYTANVWTYKGKGEKNYQEEILLLMTEEEFNNFNINSKYGYVFGFVRNGDYSPLNFSDCVKAGD